MTLAWDVDETPRPDAPEPPDPYRNRRIAVATGGLGLVVLAGLALAATSRQGRRAEAERQVLAVAEIEQRAIAASDAELLASVWPADSPSASLRALRDAQRPLPGAWRVGDRGTPEAVRLSSRHPGQALELAEVDVRLRLADRLGEGEFIARQPYFQRADGSWRRGQAPGLPSPTAGATTVIAHGAVTVTLSSADVARMAPLLPALDRVLRAWCRDAAGLRVPPGTPGRRSGRGRLIWRLVDPGGCRYRLWALGDVFSRARWESPMQATVRLPSRDLVPLDEAATELAARTLARQVIRHAFGDPEPNLPGGSLTSRRVLEAALVDAWMALAVPATAGGEAAAASPLRAQDGTPLPSDGGTYPGLEALLADQEHEGNRADLTQQAAAARLARDLAAAVPARSLVSLLIGPRRGDTLATWTARAGVPAETLDRILAAWEGAPPPFPARSALLMATSARPYLTAWQLIRPGSRWPESLDWPACASDERAVDAAWLAAGADLVVACATGGGGFSEALAEARLVTLDLAPGAAPRPVGTAVAAGPLRSGSLVAAPAGPALAWWTPFGQLVVAWEGLAGPLTRLDTGLAAGEVVFPQAPRFSPDGRQLAYQDRERDGGAWAAAVIGAGADQPRWRAPGGLAIWLPDSSALVLLPADAAAEPALALHAAESGAPLRRVALPAWDGDPARRAVDGADPAGNVSWWPVAWSDDGEWLAILYHEWSADGSNGPAATAVGAWNRRTDETRLQSVPRAVDTAAWRPGTSRLTLARRWSPWRGERLAALEWDLAEKTLNPLPGPGALWSPDGRWRVSEDPSSGRMDVVAAAGSESLWSTAGAYFSASWQPAGAATGPRKESADAP